MYYYKIKEGSKFNMKLYNFQGIDGCLTIIIILFIVVVLFKLFAGFVILTLPLWGVVAVIYIGKKLYENYILKKNKEFNSSAEYNKKMNDNEFDNTSENSGINRDAEDVEFKEYDE